MFDDQTEAENVIVVSFAQDSQAYQALSALKELDSQGRIEVEEAVVVTRDDHGQVYRKDQVEGDGYDQYVGTAGGGLIGLLIGIVAGPVGMLVGGATGVLAGSLVDLADSEDTDTVLADLATTIRVGHTALLAQVIERSPDVINSAMANLSGTVVRRSSLDVETEIAVADQAAAAAKEKARETLRKAHREEHRKEAHAKVEALKAKFHPARESATTSS